jgi:formylglycine-generating enzyme required for sulfatase activity
LLFKLEGLNTSQKSKRWLLHNSGCEIRGRMNRINLFIPTNCFLENGRFEAFSVPRLQTLLECIGRAVLENGALPAHGPFAFGDSLFPVVRSSLQIVGPRLSEADLRAAFREVVGAPQETVELQLRDAVAAVAGDRSDREALAGVLEQLVPCLRQALRRPGDPAGTSLPEHLPVAKPEDWLAFFPDRLSRFKTGQVLDAFDSWQLMDLRGYGPYGETWRGWVDNHPENATAALKFITDPVVAENFQRHEELFRQILDLEPMSGLVQLRSVYLLGDPPCLESSFVSGYDATGLMRDWSLGSDKSKPDRAAVIIKRLAKIVGTLHQLDPPIVHRGLKPCNILFHPMPDGKVTIWLSDLGWGQLSSARALEQTGPARARLQSKRGSYAPLYASPQQKGGKPPDPLDDVYALGVIWYQLLKRDPSAVPPIGREWAMEFRKDGLTDGHALLLAACLEDNPDNRPADAMVLAAQIDKNFGKGPIDSGSNAFVLKGGSGTAKPLDATKPQTVAAPGNSAPTLADLPRSFKNSIGMEFVLIPAGSFMMGSPVEEKGRHEWENPIHLVHITRPFYLGIHPVTQSQYQQVLNRNPSYFTSRLGGGPNHPVEQVSWDDAIEFCERLTGLALEAADCHLYRLPSEAEWEYACRGGTTTPYHFGETVTLEEVHFFGLNASTYSKVVSTAGKTEKVGSHQGNPRGLFDMHGNVLEWCNDWWSEEYYEESPETDPMGPKEGWHRVVRGGSFSQFVSDCRSASRLGRAPASRLNTVGFRVAMTIPGT